MENAIQSFQLRIKALDIPESEKKELIVLSENLQHMIGRMDFQMKRTIKDKSIMVNLLNRTIEELRLRQEEVELANQALQIQKQLVEEQSEKLAEQLHMLEKSYSELEQFSYIASHDLKSPLRTIASYAGLLRRRYSDRLDDQSLDYIDYIVKGASHMNEIIRDLLEYSGISKSKQLEKVCLNDTLDLAMENLQTEISETHAKISLGPLPEVVGYRTALVQLFQNLLSNAIKYGGDATPAIRITASEAKGFWQITVADNGLGLDENFQDKAFMPFQRVSHLDRPGTGMGLAICKKIVMMHDGSIWYKSMQGKGTTFYFTLAKEIESGKYLSSNQ